MLVQIRCGRLAERHPNPLADDFGKIEQTRIGIFQNAPRLWRWARCGFSSAPRCQSANENHFPQLRFALPGCCGSIVRIRSVALHEKVEPCRPLGGRERVRRWQLRVPSPIRFNNGESASPAGRMSQSGDKRRFSEVPTGLTLEKARKNSAIQRFESRAADG